MSFTEVLDSGRFKFYTDKDFDNTLKPTAEDIEINITSKNIKFKYGDNSEYYCDINSHKYTETYNSKGRMCVQLDYEHSSGTVKSNGYITQVSCQLILWGVNSNNANQIYDANWYLLNTGDFVTNGPDGGQTPIHSGQYGSCQSVVNDCMRFGASPILTYNVDGVSAEYVIDIPMFESRDDAIEYLNTGNPEKSINYREPTESDPDAEFYYYDYKYCKIDTNTKRILETISTADAKFKMKNRNDFVAFVRSDGDNYELRSHSDTVLIFDPHTLKYDIEVPFSDIEIKVLNGVDGDKLGDIYTNIPFVESLDEAKDIEKIKDSYNGINDDMELTEIDVNGSFIGAYYVTMNELNDISQVIYSNDATLQSALKEGLWMYGENPIDCVVDLCFYPFDLSSFISGQRNVPLKFGSYSHNVNYNKITGTHTPLTLVNQRIIPIYNDFRDYNTVTYSLFLPYYGIIPIPGDVVGNTLKIVVYFDVFTSQLKYYIFINGSVLTVVECSVGRHMSVVGSNWVTKSGQNINDFQNALSSAGNIAGSVASLDAGGLLSGISGVLNASMNYLSKPTTSITGSTTGGLNIYDPMSCYLIVEQFETIKPVNLNSEYGIPCYSIKILSGLKGFVQISDCKLKSHATDDEQNEILTILKNGIII